MVSDRMAVGQTGLAATASPTGPGMTADDGTEDSSLGDGFVVSPSSAGDRVAPEGLPSVRASSFFLCVMNNLAVHLKGGSYLSIYIFKDRSCRVPELSVCRWLASFPLGCSQSLSRGISRFCCLSFLLAAPSLGPRVSVSSHAQGGESKGPRVGCASTDRLTHCSTPGEPVRPTRHASAQVPVLPHPLAPLASGIGDSSNPACSTVQ